MLDANFLARADFLAPLSMTDQLSRRERQIMDILFRMGKASAAEVHEALEDPPSYSATRATLRILKDKGHVRQELQGLRHIFIPKVSQDNARRSAVKHLVKTFFGGSPADAVSALIDETSSKLSEADLKRLALLIEKARKEGK